MNDREQLSAWLQAHPAQPRADTVDRLLRYVALLDDESERTGVVARNDRPRLGMRHIRESLAPALLKRVAGRDLLDIGSGGGLPGIPLAIVGGCRSVTLLEPRAKRAVFLDRVVIQLGIADTRVVEGTLEELARDATGTPWDVATARGVGWDARMVRALGVVLAPSGILIRYGPPSALAAGVEIEPIEAQDPRAIHIWPRASWPLLAGE